MGNPVVHFEVLGKDGEALQSFYSDMFDWKINADNPMSYGIVETGGEGPGIGGGIATSPTGTGHVTFYVAVPDPQAALDNAERLGGTTIMGVTEIPDMVTFALFADPEGNVVGVVRDDA